MSQEELILCFRILAHDLKSPIFAVDGFSELLLADYGDKLDEEGQDFLRRIRSSTLNMKKTLDQMTHLVRLLARPNARRPTPLRELVEEVLLKHNYAIDEGGITIEVPEELPTVDVDPEKVREAIGAVISNALFFTDREKGERRIAVQCTRNADGVRLCIRDNGIGVDMRYASQIFDLGGASKLDRARGGGPGYGLYLAKRVAESHGGTLSVESEPGQGSTFCMTLPE